jgi:hypothetical protein
MLTAALLAGCAARTPPRPVGSQTADPGAIDAFRQATRQCAGLTTMTAELKLSGRAAGEKISGTLHAGLAAPASIRFEAVAPFGAPIFILAGRNDRATLLFPRDDRVLADASVSEVLDRITGLSLGAHDLRLILTGCLADNAAASDGRAWPGGWRAVTVGPAISAYLREINGAPTVVGADHGGWRIDYANHLNGFPRSVRIRSATQSPAASNAQTVIDITAVIDQLQINTGIADQAFVVDIPPTAERLTIDHLRAVAPLKGSS